MANRSEVGSQQSPSLLVPTLEALKQAEDQARTRLFEAMEAYVPKVGLQCLLFAAVEAYAKASHRRRVAEREMEP